MIDLFTDAGLAALRRFVDRSTLLAFDLDGTLAPFPDSPSAVRVPGAVRQCLVRLAQEVPVAVVTGRACRDARSHLGFPPTFLVGNHGAEGLPGAGEREAGFVRLCRGWQRQLRRLLPRAETPGVFRQYKGATLTLHYRDAPDREAAHRRILEAIGRLRPAPRRIPGSCLENVLPPDAPDKGDAIVALPAHTGCHRAVFVGDDETDEVVFRRGDARILGIRIGDAPGSQAGYRLRQQADIGRLLDEIAVYFS